jgi:hydrogenase expression/formation protein HypE
MESLNWLSGSGMKNGRVKLIHGGGGEAMQELISLISESISKRKVEGGIGLDELDDAATIPFQGRNLVFTTDSYTVKPLFFSGGDIGKLSVCGTVNDLAVMGARPIAISSAFVVGEGFALSDLKRIVDSMDKVSREADTPIVTGDTKVVEDNVGLIINTTGIGVAVKVIQDSGLMEGDKIIVNGPIGDHGIAIMAEREGIEFETSLESDCAPLWGLVEGILGYEIHAMKDPTRGGIANSLNEFARKSGVGVLVYEEEIPVREEVRAASEMLGIDPLTVANEGKVLVGVSDSDAEKVLKKIRKSRYGGGARIIGEVTRENKGRVILETVVGGSRILEAPMGDPVPRVC